MINKYTKIILISIILTSFTSYSMNKESMDTKEKLPATTSESDLSTEQKASLKQAIEFATTPVEDMRDFSIVLWNHGSPSDPHATFKDSNAVGESLLVASRHEHEILDADSSPVNPRRDLFTALHYAAEGGHTDLVKLLLENNAKIDAACKIGCMPLHLAALIVEDVNEKIDVVSLLLKSKAKPLS